MKEITPKAEDDLNDNFNEINAQQNAYSNITVRNLNKYFSEKDFDFDNNKYYRSYLKLKSILF